MREGLRNRLRGKEMVEGERKLREVERIFVRNRKGFRGWVKGL